MTEKEVKSDAVATVKPTVSEGLALVNKKLGALQTIAETPFKTGGQMTGVLPGKTVDIKTEQNMTTLIRCMAVVIAKEKAYNEACDKLGLKTSPVFTQDGGTSEQWCDDIKIRISVVQSEETRKKLETAQATLMSLMDKEDKLALALADLEKI